MYNHAPAGYHCPFCRLIAGIEDEHVRSKQADIFYQSEKITAFIASDWMPGNPGHVLIIPNEHLENLYDIDDASLAEIHVFSKRVAIALKEVYGCEGVSVRQHNEHAGYQDVWHYHLHVFPRYENDNLYPNHGRMKPSDPKERAAFAARLKAFFE